MVTPNGKEDGGHRRTESTTPQTHCLQSNPSPEGGLRGAGQSEPRATREAGAERASAAEGCWSPRTMSTSLFCCCCCANPPNDEREPLARSHRNRKQVKVLKKEDKLVVKHINVHEFDNKFSAVAELYNEQVENHEIMQHCATRLKDGTSSTSLKECIQTLKVINSSCDVTVKMEGYNFSLVATAKEELPENLKEAQELVKRLSRATKLIISNQTKLGEMVLSTLQKKTQMADEIKHNNSGYLDQVRLQENLEENVLNIDRAKQLSKEYVEEASVIIKEMAEMAGINNI